MCVFVIKHMARHSFMSSRNNNPTNPKKEGRRHTGSDSGRYHPRRPPGAFSSPSAGVLPEAFLVAHLIILGQLDLEGAALEGVGPPLSHVSLPRASLLLRIGTITIAGIFTLASAGGLGLGLGLGFDEIGLGHHILSDLDAALHGGGGGGGLAELDPAVALA